MQAYLLLIQPLSSQMLNLILQKTTTVLQQHWPLLLTICGAFVLGVALLAFRFLRRRGYGQGGGHSSKHPQHRVEASLRRLPKTFIIFSRLEVPRLDGKGKTRLHHVVLSPGGIFVIHVQHERGLILGGPQEAHWQASDNGRSFINPVIRNSYHVASLAAFLGVPKSLCHSVVFFDSPVRFETPQPPYLLVEEGLARHILSFQTEVLPPAELARVVEMTRALVEGTRRAWTHNKPTLPKAAPGKT